MTIKEQEPWLLLVEDDKNDQRLFKRVVGTKDCPITIHTADTVEEAVRILRSALDSAKPAWSTPKLMVLDINLPGQNGFYLLEKIRGCGPVKTLPVVIFSTSNASEDRAYADDLAATCFIKKPDSIEELRAVGREISHVWRSITAPNAKHQ
ncbi:MAG: response regulator [Pseudomonadota bacterium]